MSDAFYVVGDTGVAQGALRLVVEQWDRVKSEFGPDCVLLMAEEVERIPRESSIPVFYFPVPDDPNGLADDVFAAVRGVCNALRGAKVLTICHMGENRSGLASALILMAKGLTADEAISTLRSHAKPRSVGRPHVLWNPGFEAQVRAA